MANEKKKTDKPATQKEVIAAISTLRGEIGKGKEIYEELSGKPPGQKKKVPQIATEMGVSDAKVRNLRLVYLAYRKKGDLDRLFAQMRKHGRPIGITFLERFSSIPGKKQREQFQHEAIRENWSCGKVKRELTKRHGRRRDGGRRQTIKDVEDFKVALAMVSRRWTKLYEDNQQRDDKGNTGMWHFDMSAHLKGKINAVYRAITDLLDKLDEEDAAPGKPRSETDANLDG